MWTYHKGKGVLFLFLGMWLVAWGPCPSQKTKPVGTPLVVGEHVVITDSDLVSYGIPLSSLSKGQRDQILEEWRSQVALYEEAVARGYLERPDIQRRLKLVEISALASWMLDSLHKTLPSPNVEAFLQTFGDLFRARGDLVITYTEDSSQIPSIRAILSRRWAIDGIKKALERLPNVQSDVAENVVLGEWVVSHLPESLWKRVSLPQQSLEIQGPFRLGEFWIFLRISSLTTSQDYLLPLERIRSFVIEYERMKRQEALVEELKARHLQMATP